MNGYLGATYKVAEVCPIEAALWFIGSYGQIDGSHHKQWVIDQVARILKGTPVLEFTRSWDEKGDGNIYVETDYVTDAPSQDYLDWVVTMRGDYDDFNEEWEYDYDEGIAP
jgi:hypothetical protein